MPTLDIWTCILSTIGVWAEDWALIEPCDQSYTHTYSLQLPSPPSLSVLLFLLFLRPLDLVISPSAAPFLIATQVLIETNPAWDSSATRSTQCPQTITTTTTTKKPSPLTPKQQPPCKSPPASSKPSWQVSTRRHRVLARFEGHRRLFLAP